MSSQANEAAANSTVTSRDFSPVQTKKLASNAAVICYGLGDLASQFVWTFVGSYLTIFYTDIVGLTPAVISAIMMGARVWDAINDPMMGAIAERTRSRWGRFRPYIAFGCPFLAIFGVLTFTHPFGGTSAMGVFWATFTYIGAGMLYTLVNIPYGAMAAVMTEDTDQRNTKAAFLANKPVITGCGGLDELYEVLRGNSYQETYAQLGGLISVTYSPSMIQTAVQDMVDYLDGKDVEQDHVIACENVSADNVANYESFS